MPHSPGPWHVDHDTREDMEWNNHIAMPNGNTVCFMAHGGPEKQDEFDANARLIAAAPDLLEAAALLEAAEDFNANDCDECEGQGEPEACPKCFPLFDDARIKRRLAIAKAIGPGGVVAVTTSRDK